MHVYITGIAGFIGYHLALSLHQRGTNVSGCDAFTPYYDPELKLERAHELEALGIEIDPCDLRDIPEKGYTHIAHLAAQPGVRYSLENPMLYAETNVCGMVSVVELARKTGAHLIYASSSSVYGRNTKRPFSEDDIVTSPASLYAATKLADEHIASAYHHLYGIHVTGLRFFTVYGPYGRPDMAYFSFARAIEEGKAIRLFNEGQVYRDFTYIDDVVAGTVAALDAALPCEVVNLGKGKAEPVGDLVRALERGLGRTAHLEKAPMQQGDVVATEADVAKAERLLGYSPKISLDEGISRFVAWYRTRRPTAAR